METKLELNKTETKLESNRMETKFCKFCGEKVAMDAVICIKCGRQIEEFKMGTQQASVQPQQIIINNANTSANSNVSTNNVSGTPMGNPKSKITALVLCVCLGWVGGHKFYEGKSLMGIIYLFTFGLCGIGIVLDFLALLAKPSTYYI
ncbi:TM2 domain-containing protein [Clostridium tagluense]|uniref:TM2 domain-containing protein n=1 Tax=Clostridium tagluense TaxID=360422 RepID=UPI001CF569E1|nr:TM2 domain-containing protein [Clostridium tagluense]MCB2297821.1 TM2 domain-containing protein [Clostridium tagluense]